MRKLIEIKQISLLILSLCILLAVSGCGTMSDGVSTEENDSDIGSTQAVVSSESDNIILDIEDIMEQSTHIIEAVYEGTELDDKIEELCFKPINTVKGMLNADEKTIHVLKEGYEFIEADLNEEELLEKGETYLLFLEKKISVYYPHPEYVPLGNLIVKGSDNDWDNMYEMAMEISDRTKETTPAEYGTPFIDSDDINELAEFATNIFVVRIDSILERSLVRETTAYKATVTKTIKNSPDNYGEIIITAFNDTVDLGEEYLVFLGDASRSSPVYVLASKKNSIVSINEISNYPETVELMNTAVNYNAKHIEKSDEEILAEEEQSMN